MKNKFKVRIQRIQLDDPDRPYWITSIRGAVGIVGGGGSNMALYRVGDKITEKDLTSLFNNRNNDITVTV